jgi:uncharacterized membrane protein YjfL (UPF0719 family)
MTRFNKDLVRDLVFREQRRNNAYACVCVCVCVYIYIYITSYKNIELFIEVDVS